METSRSAFERLERQAIDRFVDSSQKPERRVRIALVDILEISEGVEFGIMPDEDLDRGHAAICFFARAASFEKWF